MSADAVSSLGSVSMEGSRAKMLLLRLVVNSMSAASWQMPAEVPSDGCSIKPFLLLHRLRGADCGVENDGGVSRRVQHLRG
jgi:hypothetical protein